jgi:excinuclease ABC subunit C
MTSGAASGRAGKIVMNRYSIDVAISMGVRNSISRLPASPGVYRFRDPAGQVLYLGRATSLRSRVGSYWSDLRERRHLAPMVAAVAQVEAVACASVLEAAWLERNLLEARMPAWNRTAGGQEVEVYIRLNVSGLSVSHRRQGSCSGPYLGGLRTRQAVRGLRRILPPDRDAALVRGPGGLDPGTRMRRTEAILRGEPGAVDWARASLERLRDQASEVLAFELSARIQEEMTALGWITSPQRVTRDTGDFEARGWHDGFAVRFGFRDGRLREWEQRAPSPRPSGPQPPGELTDFAQRTAELAASLARHPEPE